MKPGPGPRLAAGRVVGWQAMLRRGALALLLTASCLGCDAPPPPERPTRFKGADGATYYLLDRGQYKAFYDAYGKLQRLEYDSNNDGKTDVWAHHNGAKVPGLLEIDDPCRRVRHG